jgi:hypothetical protein
MPEGNSRNALSQAVTQVPEPGCPRLHVFETGRSRDISGCVTHAQEQCITLVFDSDQSVSYEYESDRKSKNDNGSHHHTRFLKNNRPRLG